MKKKEETKTVTKREDPQLSTSKKLDAIKTGEKIKRSKGANETKNVIHTGKDGAKIIAKQVEEKYEESAVLRKKRNYVMFESKLGTETNTEIIGKIGAPMKKEKPKPVREVEPRVEEKIVQTRKRKEYLDNYQYHETKDIKRDNPRYHCIVEHKRLGDIIGGTFEETSYQRQVFSQGSNRPNITESKTLITTTGTATNPKLRANKSEARLVKKTLNSNGPISNETSTKKTTTRTTRNTTTNENKRDKNPTSATATNEKIHQTTMKRRNDGTTSKTETRTETKTTTSGTRGEQKTSSTTKTTTTRTRGGDKTESKTETKTETKVEQKGGDEGGSSIRKKYAKRRF